MESVKITQIRSSARCIQAQIRTLQALGLRGIRKSGGIPANFEGGQTPLQRRVPKRGFNSHFAEIEIVNIGELDKRFTGTVTTEDLFKAGLISNKGLEVKILGTGKVTKALIVKAHRFSESAKAALEAAGGKAEVI